MKRKAVAVIALAVMMTACAQAPQTGTTDTAAAGDTSSAASTVELASVEEPITELDESKYVKLPEDYSTLTVKISKPAGVTDAEIDSELELFRQYASEAKEVEGRDTAQSGDIVNINYVGTINGEQFEGGSAENVDIELGSGSFIDGFEDAVIGMKVGEEKDITCVFPDDYPEESVAGKESVFKVTLNSIQELVLPELSDDFVKGLDITDENGNAVTTVDGLRKYVGDNLKSMYEEECEDSNRQNAFDALVDASELIGELPAEQINPIKAEMLEIGYTDEEAAEEYAKKELFERLVVQAAAKQNGISVTEEDVKEYANDYFGDQAQMFLEQVGEDEIDIIKNNIIRERVAEIILKTAKVEVSDAPAVTE